MVKLRKTSERSSSSMLLEPPPGLNGTTSDSAHPRWRYLKYIYALRNRRKSQTDKNLGKLLERTS